MICTIQFIGNMDDIEYMVHAANAYPMMVEMLRQALEGAKYAFNCEGICGDDMVDIEECLKEIGEME